MRKVPPAPFAAVLLRRFDLEAMDAFAVKQNVNVVFVMQAFDFFIAIACQFKFDFILP